MNEQVKKIYDFVQQMEDLYYSKLTCGEDLTADLMNTAQATSFQRVRYFIEMMIEQNTTGEDLGIKIKKIIKIKPLHLRRFF